MYLSKLAQRTGEDSMSVTYSDLASVVQVWIKRIAIAIDSTLYLQWGSEHWTTKSGSGP